MISFAAMDDIRWQQRFSNLQRAFGKLRTAMHIFDMDGFERKREVLKKDLDTADRERAALQLEALELEREGVIQRFEYTYELFIRTLEDLIKFQDGAQESLRGSRDILAAALQRGLITDHDGWRAMVKSRNETTHIYDEAKVNEIVHLIISRYFPLMEQLYTTLEAEHDR